MSVRDVNLNELADQMYDKSMQKERKDNAEADETQELLVSAAAEVLKRSLIARPTESIRFFDFSGLQHVLRKMGVIVETEHCVLDELTGRWKGRRCIASLPEAS